MAVDIVGSGSTSAVVIGSGSSFDHILEVVHVCLAGDDHLFGGDGNDYFRGNEGDDSLYGENGVDHLYSNSGNDGLFGGLGGTDGLKVPRYHQRTYAGDVEGK